MRPWNQLLYVTTRGQDLCLAASAFAQSMAAWKHPIQPECSLDAALKNQELLKFDSWKDPQRLGSILFLYLNVVLLRRRISIDCPANEAGRDLDPAQPPQPNKAAVLMSGASNGSGDNGVWVSNRKIDECIRQLKVFFRHRCKKVGERACNNFALFLINKSSPTLLPLLIKALDFLYGTAMLFTTCRNYAVECVHLYWMFLNDLLITTYGLDIRSFLAQNAGDMMEILLKLSLETDVKFDVYQVIDLFGPTVEWRDILSADRIFLGAMIKDPPPPNGRLAEVVVSPQISESGESGELLSHRRRVDDSRQSLPSRPRTQAEPPPPSRNTLLAPPVVKPSVFRRTTDGSTSNPGPAMPKHTPFEEPESELETFVCYANQLHTWFMLICCYEELCLQTALERTVSQRVYRLIEGLYVHSTRQVFRLYDNLWRPCYDGTPDGKLNGCSVLSGLALVVLYNIGSTKVGAQYLRSESVNVLRALNRIFDFINDEALHPLIGGLMACVATGKPTDINVVLNLNPKKIKHYSQIMRCTYCGLVADGSRKLKICGECHLARYCDRSCQQEDWKSAHSKLCKNTIY